MRIRGTTNIRGFTLVELLVVMSIIAILMGLLIPALSKSRKQANRTECLANLRQIYFAYQFYSQSFGDQIPLGYASDPTTPGVGAEQVDFLVWNGSNPADNPPDTLFGLLYDANLIPDPRVFYCPSTGNPQFQYNTPENPWPQVTGMDTRVAFGCRPVVYWPPGEVPDPMPRLIKMKSLAIVADVVSTSALVSERHSSGVNALYGDGSAHYVPVKAFSADLGKVSTGQYSSLNNSQILNTSVTPNLGVWGDLDRN